MKNSKIKRIIALILSAMMLLSFASCGDSSGNTDNTTEAVTEERESTTQAKTLARAPQGDKTTTESSSEEQPNNISANELSDANLRYVMIYNPKIYDETVSFDPSVLKTGYLGNQIDIGAYRADGLKEEVKLYTISQKDLLGDIKIKPENVKSDFIPKTYRVGDTRTFYCYSEHSTATRVEKTFECVYEGDHCYIWSAGNVNVDALKECGNEFDEKIFNPMVESFGEPRFSGKNGKVNLLFTELPETICGVFYLYDIFSKTEVTEDEIASYKINTDHDIIYINSLFVGYEQLKTNLFSTMAHEFQHLINATNALSTPEYTFCKTWLNEAISGYIEEHLYPGVQLEAKRYYSYNNSGLIRNGQSLYNFENTNDDIGVYGSVFLFSRYLAKLSGEDVFSKIHDYWRNSYDFNISEASAIEKSVSASVKSRIDNLVAYPSSWTFNSSSEKWMSKLTLDFYLSVLSNKDSVSEFEYIKPEALLYDEINGAEIEGGGRIVFAVNETTFEIPDEADSGLVYVGLDEDFNTVTPFVCS